MLIAISNLNSRWNICLWDENEVLMQNGMFMNKVSDHIYHIDVIYCWLQNDALWERKTSNLLRSFWQLSFIMETPISNNT